eukprot:CAMPEP_0119277914 /NCGR_PEP_ID=MMETSP1329-20130426/18138_1 /TAXON_ID=114041 /ORGANISM="Genus nov. species nov., Strain RCC1024" /LENGTH=287 /DNA_ID=CAMNT_0007278407 /DNA_START=45 /DNA_END=904 /DNA_ORIENTATION=-
MARSLWLLLALLVRIANCGITFEIGSKKPKPQPVKATRKKADKTPTRQALPPPPFVSRGWLAKKGHKRRNWKRRYFVLADDWGTLTYYDDETCRVERGRVALAGARCSLGLDYVPKRAHVFAFTVRARDDVYHLECSSEGERQRWLRTLRTAAASSRDSVDDAIGDAVDDVATLPVFERRGVPTDFDVESVDCLVGDAGAFHREKWLASLNRLLANERTLKAMNAALRGAYIVQSVELTFVGDARIAVRGAALSPEDLETPTSRPRHRLLLDLRWPQDLKCVVRGYR